MARAFARKLALCAVAAAALAATPAAAQQRRVELLYTPDGIRLDYPRDAVWRVKARRVVEHRARLRAARQFDQLNAPALAGAPAPSAAAVTGTLFMPSVLVSFKNTDTTTLPKAAQYNQVFYTTTPLAGRSYTVRTFYEELSNNAFSVQGATFGWTQNDATSSYFLAACGTGKDPLGCTTGRQRLHELFVEALAQIDGSVNFGLYDNDGPDGQRNSPDDDGYVDVVQFVQPLIGTECGGPGYGAHASSLSGLVRTFSPYTTNDRRPGGGFVRVDPYHLVAGVGGTSCMSSSEIMAIGAAAHELGHGLGLPDLYDTDPNDSDDSEGIGEWGLMGTGIYTSRNSPAHYEAWSKEQMGWVVVRELSAAGTHSFGPVVSKDSVFLIRVQGGNPRGEYFLLENKQAVGADTANMDTGGTEGPKVGGLLIWHIDPQQINNGRFFNVVNTGPIHGVALMQADGRNELRNSTSPKDRGDSGDPYPGSTLNTVFSFGTNPAPRKNSDGSFAGFAIDQIQQLAPGGAVSFRLSFSTTLALADVVAQLLNGSGTLNPSQLADLDYEGNRNGSFDVGDFKSWLDRGQPPLGTGGGEARP